MDQMTCPTCAGIMAERVQGPARYHQCESCRGVFLGLAELGALIEGEHDWHTHRSTDTSRLPRITSEMTAPPPSLRARSYLDSLFTRS
ncbi:MAG: zf-TFIIB domain-containing protein [Marmoricola sp.]